MKPLVLHEGAREELDASAAFYERRRRGLGRQFLLEVTRVLALIQENPAIGSPYPDDDLWHFTLDRFPFAVLYLEFEAEIWVAAIAHGSREPGYWRGRKPS